MLNLESRPAYLKCGPTDMRKSINGLSELVQSGFEISPFEGALFVFCNRNRDRVKILVWDGDGFWLLFKRLEKGHFRWPQPGDSQIMTLSNEELAVLLDGVKVELKLKRNEVTERKIS